MGRMSAFWSLGSHEETKLLRNVTCFWSFMEADVFAWAPGELIKSGT